MERVSFDLLSLILEAAVAVIPSGITQGTTSARMDNIAINFLILFMEPLISALLSTYNGFAASNAQDTNPQETKKHPPFCKN